MSGAWRPWRALGARDDIDFALVDLPPGLRAVLARQGPDRVILIDRSLEPSERLAALAHELVHDERGGAGRVPPPPHPLSVASRREETRVDRIVTDRLVPPMELATFLEARAGIDPPIEPWQVAEEFGVPHEYAERALRLFAQRRPA